MSVIPLAPPELFEEPIEDEPDEDYWSLCPECKCPGYHFDTPSAYEIYQVCNGCGNTSHNHHFMAAEFEAWKKQQEAKVA